MIQHFRGKTVFANLVLGAFLLQLIAPLAAAQTLPLSTPVTIGYFPTKVGRYGTRITFRVHVTDDADLRQVIFVMLDSDKPIRGAMTALTQEGPVPVEVLTLKPTPLFTQAKLTSQSKNSIAANELLQVSQVTGEFLRVVSQDGKKGFVRWEDVQVVSWGTAYAVTLPASMTSRSSLTYRFEVIGEELLAATEPIKMRLLTDDEIQKLLAQYRAAGKSKQTAQKQKVGEPKKQAVKKPEKESRKTPVVVKAAPAKKSSTIRIGPLWGGLAIAGGLAYYFLRGKQSSQDEDVATLNVLVDWE
ncbi:MAG: hypothetical protein ONB24_10380 [candidate division KSB1 bacterium]|nr:hypothetical protein [candidate division KSB1 bacterium]